MAPVIEPHLLRRPVFATATAANVVFGMAFGGWISGVIFDVTGSYRAAFANGALWNVLNAGIALALLTRSVRRVAPA